MPNPRPHAKSQKRKLELKCEYCPSTFISNNNLRRHIYELHKDYITHLPAPPEINCDENMRCRRCEMKFETKLEWIEHKVTEARSMKPYGPFQWGCDLCGAYVSRKEKLINHIHNHMKENFIVPVKQLRQEMGQTSTTAASMSEVKPHTSVKIKEEINETESMQDNQESTEEQDDDNSLLSGKGAYGEDAADELPDDYEAVEVDAEADDDEADEDEEDEDIDGSSDAAVVNVNENANDGQAAVSESEEDDEDEEEEEDDDEEVDESEDTSNQSIPQKNNNDNMGMYNKSSSEAEIDDDSKDDDDEEMDVDDNTASSVGDTDKASEAKSRYSCDLCQVYFDSQPELQQHVKMHFLNGPGSVTFSNKSKQNSRANNNGNDVGTISTS